MEIISEMNPLDSVIKGNAYYCDSPILYQCRRYLRHCKILATIEELTAMYGRSECIYIQVFLKETLAQVGFNHQQKYNYRTNHPHQKPIFEIAKNPS